MKRSSTFRLGTVLIVQARSHRFLLSHIAHALLIGEVVVCMECNSREEKQSPWLFEHNFSATKVRDPSAHSWEHTLVLVSNVEPRPTLRSVEDRLVSLDGRFREFEEPFQTLEKRSQTSEEHFKRLDERLDGLERMVRTGFAKRRRQAATGRWSQFSQLT